MSKTQPGPFVAVIGDMVRSRALPAATRARAQREFADLVTSINQQFRADLASRFVITIGDEFQGLLTNPEVIPDLIWLVEARYHARAIRIGVGLGVLHTPLQRSALNIDGPALHEARAAILEAGAKRLLGGVFKGFGQYDDVLLGFAQTLRYLRGRLTARQMEVVQMLRDGET